jgi:hypothetical protein
MGPLDLDRARHSPARDDTGQEPTSHHLRRHRPAHRPALLPGPRKAISVTFTGFCEQLLAAYPHAPVVAVICDNVIIHRSKIVQLAANVPSRLLVVHGARYSPHDNPVERVWGALKAWLANNPT